MVQGNDVARGKYLLATDMLAFYENKEKTLTAKKDLAKEGENGERPTIHRSTR